MGILYFLEHLNKTKNRICYYILKRIFEKDNYNTSIFGFGRMHLHNAGICMIDQIISKNPKYCFIDWFVTWYDIVNCKTIEYLDTIIYKF